MSNMQLLTASRMTDEELIFRVRRGLRLHKFEGWPLRFAISVAGASKRPEWAPSEKQRAVLERLVEEMRAPELIDLIDAEDGTNG